MRSGAGEVFGAFDRGGKHARMDVRIISDNALPAPHDWVLIDDRGELYVAVRESAYGPQVLDEVRTAITLPEQLAPLSVA